MADRLVRSAVALIETPTDFLLQERPNLPGKLAYPGKKQFLGGHVEKGEDPRRAVARELGEETTLSLPPEAFSEYWSDEYIGEGKQGEPVLRHVSVYYLGLTALGQKNIRLREKGALISVPKRIELVRAHQDSFTPFALEMLSKFLQEKKR